MSIRNNSDRISPRDLNQDSPLNNNQETNQTTQAQPDPQVAPMSFSAPTEFVELPSKGEYYLEGHPLHGISSIEIKYMTAKEEDILTSKTLMKKNLTIDRLLQSIMVDKSINPDDLLTGDKNALIISARITGYGSNYSTGITCPACTAQNVYSIDLNDALESFDLEDAITDDVKKTDNGTFIVKTPRTGAMVEMRLLNGHDEKRMIKQEERRKRHKLPESLATSAMGAFIVSVNGSSDPMYIGSFIENAPAADARYVREAYKAISPNVGMSFPFSCKNCDHEQEMEVPLNAEFFWPKR
tara:strand:+ start:795 stop:1688 length:894 start_codon:yes stop_codon:yes gene_type:complete